MGTCCPLLLILMHRKFLGRYFLRFHLANILKYFIHYPVIQFNDHRRDWMSHSTEPLDYLMSREYHYSYLTCWKQPLRNMPNHLLSSSSSFPVLSHYLNGTSDLPDPQKIRATTPDLCCLCSDIIGLKFCCQNILTTTYNYWQNTHVHICTHTYNQMSPQILQSHSVQ